MTKTITKLHFNGVDYNIGGAWSLAEPTNIAVTTNGTTATITWTDPEDLRTIPPTAFSKSVLVRKVGSEPTSPTDWTIVVEETVRNTYKTSWYADTWLTSGTDYYYRVFTYATTWIATYWDSAKTVRSRTFTVTFTETSSPSGFSPVYSDDAAWLAAWSTAFDDFFNYSAVKLSTAWVETAEVKQNAGVLDITQLWSLSWWDNIMIKFPIMWIKMSKSGSTVTLSITDDPSKASDGYQYYAHSRWTFDNPVIKNAFYMWVYEWYSSSNVLKSWSGQTPTANQTMATFINYARANDNNTWDAGYEICGFYQRQFINALYMMKYGNPDWQTTIGRGFVDWNSAAVSTWWTNSQTNATYGESTGKQSMKLFGIEDWRWNVNDRIGWLCTDGSKNLWTALSWFVGDIKTTSPYANQWTYSPWTSNPCISAIAWTNGAMFYPSATVSNGNYNTYWCDYGYVFASRLAYAGGTWVNGSDAGAFRLDVNVSASNAYADLGARLMFL